MLLSMKPSPWKYRFKNEVSDRSESEGVVEFNLWELIRTNERGLRVSLSSLMYVYMFRNLERGNEKRRKKR